MKQLRRNAQTYGWPDHILAPNGEVDLTIEQRAALDEDNVEDLTDESGTVDPGSGDTLAGEEA